MKTKKVTKQEMRNVNNAYEKAMFSPFQVLNWINANRKVLLKDGQTIGAFLQSRGIKKLSLNDLFNYPDAYGKDMICKIVPMRRQCKYVDIIRVCGKCYKVVRLENTKNDFFDSLNSLIELENEKAKYEEMYGKLLQKKEDAEERERLKQEAKEIKKIVEALKVIPKYKNFTQSELIKEAKDQLTGKAA